MEPTLAQELRAMAADEVIETRGGVLFAGPLEAALRALVQLRTASRVLAPLGAGTVVDGDDVQALASEIPWPDLMGPEHRFVVHVRGELTPTLRSPIYVAQRVKDAVVAAISAAHGGRPSVSLTEPHLCVTVALTGRDDHRGTVRARIALDLAGESLHRRGYRLEKGEAPLRETLAAACVLLANLGRPDGPLVCDPLCGSGTIALEAALARAAIPPLVVSELGGGARAALAVERWPHFSAADAELLADLHADGLANARQGLATARSRGVVLAAGFDVDRRAITIARANARRAGLEGLVRFEEGDVRRSNVTAYGALRQGRGLAAIFNPPYGERIGGTRFDAFGLARDVRSALPALVDEAWAICEEGPIATALGLGADALHVRNGALRCRYGKLRWRQASGRPR